MASRLILAVAGSGKTSYLIDRLDETSQVLVITYTINNYHNIRLRIIKRFGYMPDNIVLFSYFSFLYSFCFKPFLNMRLGTKGINFNPCRNRFAKNRERYIDRSGRLYSNRIAKLLEEVEVIPDIKKRLNKYFDRILIDEIQDFAGHDFNLLPAIVSTGLDVTLVGDFFQHTFDTSRDGNINKNLHNDHDGYKSRCGDIGLVVETSLLRRSYRCSPSVCAFVTDHLGIDIQSHRDDATNIALIKDQDEADVIFADNEIIKLFYKDSGKYPCRSSNWGGVKGDDHFGKICVVLNGASYSAYQQNSLRRLAPQSRNKLYVAITRARDDLYFVPETLYRRHKAS